MSSVDRIKKIGYQYLKDLDETKPRVVARPDYAATFTEARKVEAAQSIINAQIDGPVQDIEMPPELLGISLDWTAGEANDDIVEISFGDYRVRQTLSQVDANVAIKMPTNITVSYNTLEATIELEWDEITSAVGYKVVRDQGTASEVVILDGDSGYTTTGGRVTLLDNVGDNAEHTYTIMAKDANPFDNSEFTDLKTGKAYLKAGAISSINISYNNWTLAEGVVYLNWDAVVNATGYTIERDGTEIESNLQATEYTDNVGDNSEHTYKIKANGEVDLADGPYTTVTGKAWTWVEETISLSGYTSQTVTTPSAARDIILTISSIAGGEGEGGYYGGDGGKGLNYNSPAISNGSHSFFFGCGETGGTGGSGYYSGATTYEYNGGGASRFALDGTTLCGAGGGGGRGIEDRSLGSGGGGIYSGGDQIQGGDGGGGNGGNKSSVTTIQGQDGWAVVAQGSFGSTGTNTGHGHITGSVKWKE